MLNIYIFQVSVIAHYDLYQIVYSEYLTSINIGFESLVISDSIKQSVYKH